MASLRILLGSLALLGIPAFVFCGECCKAHYDLRLQYNDEKWCSNYCCDQIVKFDCCDNGLLQVPSSERTDYCVDYFHSNGWAAALIVIGSIALIVGLCVCCCKACCCRSQSVGVQGANPGVTVVNSAMQQTVNPNHTVQQQPGYPVNQVPSYPA
ncbi:uncharacterized protein LOC128177811 [Crassostrea angulata]|uniref:uncharacterized protein LOC128170060 n=1 Tax=Magallana angulata TaxID=2784310 RepID=UPI0022B1F28E|nr:uncharacterized protein LOC128170060 [Crassostrea angulata]XP_052700637.1 uncharacterized protein LOC128177811 [Crassostrea angulata]